MSFCFDSYSKINREVPTFVFDCVLTQQHHWCLEKLRLRNLSFLYRTLCSLQDLCIESTDHPLKKTSSSRLDKSFWWQIDRVFFTSS